MGNKTERHTVSTGMEITVAAAEATQRKGSVKPSMKSLVASVAKHETTAAPLEVVADALLIHSETLVADREVLAGEKRGDLTPMRSTARLGVPFFAEEGTYFVLWLTMAQELQKRAMECVERQDRGVIFGWRSKFKRARALPCFGALFHSLTLRRRRPLMEALLAAYEDEEDNAKPTERKGQKRPGEDLESPKHVRWSAFSRSMSDLVNRNRGKKK